MKSLLISAWAGVLSKWGIDPERDIWSLGVMVQGSGQMGELLGRRRRRRRRRRRHLEIGVWNSFSFRAWIGLRWEISPRKPDHSAWNCGARLFCKNLKNQENSYFQYFQDIRKLEKSNFQYFQDMRKLKNPISSISRMRENYKHQISKYVRARNN